MSAEVVAVRTNIQLFLFLEFIFLKSEWIFPLLFPFLMKQFFLKNR